MKKLFLLVFSCFFMVSLQANSYEKNLEGKWYFDINTPLDVDTQLNMNGSISYMSSKESISKLSFTLKNKSGDIEICMINTTSKWQLGQNILSEEILTVQFDLDKEILKRSPQLQKYVEFFKQSYHVGLKSTREIKSISKDKLIMLSDGIEVIGTRKAIK